MMGRRGNNSAKALDKKGENDIIKDIKQLDVKGTLNIPPKAINLNSLTINTEHISLRNHNITADEARSYIKNAEISITKWNGKFENYFSSAGAAYVDLTKMEIKTAFKANEFDKKTKSMMEALTKWKKR